MTDRRELVLAAVFAALETVAGVKCHRNPDYELGPTDLPALVQMDGGDDVLDDDSGAYLLAQRLAVVVASAGAGGDDVGTKLSGLRALARRALAADPTLGGLARRLVYTGSDDPVMVAELGAEPYGAMACAFSVEFTEDEADPYAPG